MKVVVLGSLASVKYYSIWGQQRNPEFPLCKGDNIRTRLHDNLHDY